MVRQRFPVPLMKFLYLAGFAHLAFKCRFIHLADTVAESSHPKRDDPCSSLPNMTTRSTSPIGFVPRAVTAEMFSDVIGSVCRRFPSAGQPEKTMQIQRLVASEAWTDAVLALIAFELPQWQVRRIAYDEGEWHCALSSQRDLPDWLDQSIEARHADLPLALLSAFVDARLANPPSSRTSVPAGRRDASEYYQPLCCDNFS
jgi:hypothetical protein